MKLNLGCGKRPREGYVNIDQNDEVAPDVVWNLEVTPWQLSPQPACQIIQSDSVDEILAHHVLEHLGQSTSVFLKVMKEIYRVMKPMAIVEIKFPHHQSQSYWGDPTHIRPITLGGLNLFSKKNCVIYAERNWPNTPLAEYLDIDLEIRSTKYELTPHWGGLHQSGTITDQELDHAMNTYWNVVDEVTVVMFKAS